MAYVQELNTVQISNPDLSSQNDTGKNSSFSAAEKKVESFDHVHSNQDIDLDARIPGSEERPLVFRSTTHEVLCIVLLTFAQATNSMNQGALQLALPYISRSFSIQGSQLSWTVTSYSLVAASFLLLMARLSDIIGRKWALNLALLYYAVFALLQGFMKSHIAFDVLRGLQAIGGSVAAPSAMGMLGIIYQPGQRKNHAVAGYAAGAPIGFVSGLVVSGICSQFISWRSILFFLAIVYGILTVLVYFVVPSDEECTRIANHIAKISGETQLQTVNRDWKKIMKTLKKLDYVGVALSIVGLLLFVFAISDSGGAPQKWKTPYIIALLIIGFVTIVSFVLWETYGAKEPLMPMFIWKFPGFALCMLLVFFGWMTFQGVLMYFSPMYFQNIRHYSIILTVAAICPQVISALLVNVFAAFTMHLIPGRILMMTAMSAFTIASLLWALQPLHASYWAFAFPALCICVIGADLAANVIIQVALSAVPPNLKSTAAGIFNVVMQVGGSIGIAASTAIVTSRIGNDIENQSAEILHEGYRSAYWFGLAVSSCGLIGSVFLKVGTQGGKKDVKLPPNDYQPEDVEQA
ncbi:major facilitator superfamily domain-containing protein [Lipomyces japonicus]|uniref:major facilitator superfamily domain-containing protein n=1 Tax=Lipomyces japonicus TaxID=56871 RepID=UPI0034CD469D